MKVIATVGFALIGGVSAGAAAATATANDVQNCLYEPDRLNYMARTVKAHNDFKEAADLAEAAHAKDPALPAPTVQQGTAAKGKAFANVPKAAEQSLITAKTKLLKKIKDEGKRRMKTTDKKNNKRIKKLGLKLEKKLAKIQVTQVGKMGTEAPVGGWFGAAPPAEFAYTLSLGGDKYAWIGELASGTSLVLGEPALTHTAAVDAAEGDAIFAASDQRLSQKDCVKLLNDMSSVFKAELEDDYDSSCWTMVIISTLVVLAVLVAVLMMFCKSSNNDDDDM